MLSLGKLHGVDLQKAALAAALHDCAKHYTREQTLEIHRSGNIKLDEEDLQYPAIWHGAVAGWLGRSRYGVTDEEILDAVEHHTLGHTAPSPLLQVLMCADTTEPTRTQTGVNQLRVAVRNDLRTGLLAVLNDKIRDIRENGKQPHSRIYETIRSLEG